MTCFRGMMRHVRPEPRLNSGTSLVSLVMEKDADQSTKAQGIPICQASAHKRGVQRKKLRG